jgi:hypothetical protein
MRNKPRLRRPRPRYTSLAVERCACTAAADSAAFRSFGEGGGVTGYLLTMLGVALLGLSVAKIVGLTLLLVNGSDKPQEFLVKQAVYAVVFLGLGVGALWAGWQHRRQRK